MNSRFSILELDREYLTAFLDYCRKHRTDHDESYLSEDELTRFSIEKNITYIAVKEKKITGVYSLIPEKKFRVRIFHAEERDRKIYKNLHRKMTDRLSDDRNCTEITLFLPEQEKDIIEYMKNLGFRIERYIFVLEREPGTVLNPVFPEGFIITEMKFPEDIGCWMEIRNRAFRNLAGSHPVTENDIRKMENDSDFIREGTLILRDGVKAVGIIKVSKDVQENGVFGFIGPIAVLPEYQGKGLGRNILRAAVKVTAEKLKWKNSLCVNADNEDALKLYLDEGFQKTESVLCMKFMKNRV